MALPYAPVPTWREQFNLLEITDEVLGGLDGPANKTAKELADAIKWLHEAIAGGNAEGDVIILRHNGIQDLPVAAYQNLEFTTIVRDDTETIPGGGNYDEIVVPAGYSSARVSGATVIDRTSTATYAMAINSSINDDVNHELAGAGATALYNQPGYPQESVMSPWIPVMEGDRLAIQLYTSTTSWDTYPGLQWMQVELKK
ncbi:hypothetical protein A3197_01595 [Candidatus Thiodiazotropha endoloripes]|nr:hypothetical protein A3197_01595 [Candidatus Thiodiazotropha endoloripes]